MITFRLFGLWKEFSIKFPHDRRGYLNTITNIRSVNKDDYDAMEDVYESWLQADTLDSSSRIEYSNFASMPELLF